MHKKLLFFTVFILPFFASAQYGNKVKKAEDHEFVQKKTKPHKEITIAFGAANFLGELGGTNGQGTHFVRDFEFSTTLPSAMVGFRYVFNSRLALKAGFYYLLVSGDDKLTKEPFRNNRNLSFRSHIFELSAQGEVFFSKQQKGHLYRIKNAKGSRKISLLTYGFVGVGVFFYNPQAKYNGKWVNLQPLGTEGQGLPGGPKKYSRFSLCIPYGLGASTFLNKYWLVGLEVGIRKTFTDYIDDVSGNYYDNDILRSERGNMAADLADPSLQYMPDQYGGNNTNARQTSTGSQRGNPKYKDAYMFINITGTYIIPSKRKTRHSSF